MQGLEDLGRDREPHQNNSTMRQTGAVHSHYDISF